MDYFEQFIITFLLLFISNFILRLIFNKINYKANTKFILFDTLYISLIFFFWNIIIYYYWILKEYKTIDLWFEIILYLILLIFLPFVYLYAKKKYLDWKNTKVSIYYPLIELLIIILSLSFVSYFL